MLELKYNEFIFPNNPQGFEIVIVIDVLRAFTTTRELLSTVSSRRIRISDDINALVQMKREGLIQAIFAENKGYKMDLANYGNSPASARQLDVAGDVGLLTTNGVKSILSVYNQAEMILAAGLRDANSIHQFLNSRRQDNGSVAILNSSESEEDRLFLSCLTSLAENGNLNWHQLREKVDQTKAARRLIEIGADPEDVRLATQPDDIRFVQMVSRDENGLYIWRQNV